MSFGPPSVRLSLLALLVAAYALIGGVICPLPANASGWIVVEGEPGGDVIVLPHPPRHPPRSPRRPAMWRLEILSEDVAATIDNHHAAVKVEARFRNPCARDLEGIYYFPLPAGARIDDFHAVLGGKELAGEILDREQATQIYESLVRNTLDPALLEHYGDGLFRARIFPIPALKETSISIHYRMLIPRESGFYRFEYPLDAQGAAAAFATKVTLDIKSDAELRSVSSPRHAATIARPSKYQAHVTYAGGQDTKRGAFVVDYLTASDGLAGGVRVFQESGAPGYFLLRLSPAAEPPAKRPPASVFFVLDTSGSMATDGKMERAKHALLAALARLGAEDSFRIITFAGQIRSHSEAALPATPANISSAKEFIESLIARGGTDLNGALEHAIATVGGAPAGTVILLLSDGAPTVGITDTGEIVTSITKRTGGDYRLHVFGVGHDVNTVLLDDLARKNRGSRTYLRGDEGMEIAVTGLLDKVLYPVLTGIEVTADGVEIFGLEPPGPRDLFCGEDLILAGRYNGSGNGALKVSGTAGSERASFVYPTRFPTHGGQDEAAFHWARLRIDTLLAELRGSGMAAGDARRKEITDLGLRFGIVTPFTSMLVREPHGLVAERMGERLRDVPGATGRLEREEKGFGEASGEEAFDYAKRKADARKDLAGGKGGGDRAARDEIAELEAAAFDAQVGGRTFVLVGSHLVDCELDGRELPQADITLVFGSDDYLAFLRDNPAAAALLAAAPAVIFRWDGKVVRVDDRAE